MGGTSRTVPWSRMLRAAAAGVAGVALLGLAGCGTQSVSGTAAVAKDAKPATFDECGLLEPAKLAELVGVDKLHITAREASTSRPDGSRIATCGYYPRNVPGSVTLTISVVAGTDEQRFFAPFDRFRKARGIKDLGDRAMGAAYTLTNTDDGTRTGYLEIGALAGERGVLVRWAEPEDGTMPERNGDAVGAVIGQVLDTLPDDPRIVDGEPTGACAQLDTAAASDVLGAELTTARVVEGEAGAISCFFAGGGAELQVTVITDEKPAAEARVETDVPGVPGPVDTEVDVGESGWEPGVVELTAAANLDAERVMTVTARYGPEVEPFEDVRPEDTDLVQGFKTVLRGD